MQACVPSPSDEKPIPEIFVELARPSQVVRHASLETRIDCSPRAARCTQKDRGESSHPHYGGHRDAGTPKSYGVEPASLTPHAKGQGGGPRIHNVVTTVTLPRPIGTEWKKQASNRTLGAIAMVSRIINCPSMPTSASPRASLSRSGPVKTPSSTARASGPTRPIGASFPGARRTRPDAPRSGSYSRLAHDGQNPRRLQLKGSSSSFWHTPSSLPPSSSSRAGCPSPATRPVRALRCEPAACRRHPVLASRWRGACGPTPGAGISGQGGMGWADAVGGKGRLNYLYSELRHPFGNYDAILMHQAVYCIN
jgi:hypothetical protein